MVKFEIFNEANNKKYGEVVFNGKFVFNLDEGIDMDDWNRAGFVKLENSHHVESDDLFWYLNSRLPIVLRKEDNDKKLDYIKQTGLRVASDNFVLREIS